MSMSLGRPGTRVSGKAAMSALPDCSSPMMPVQVPLASFTPPLFVAL